MKSFIHYLLYFMLLTTNSFNGQSRNVLNSNLRQDSSHFFLQDIRNINISITHLAATDISSPLLQKFIEDRYNLIKKIIDIKPSEIDNIRLEQSTISQLSSKYESLIERDLKEIKGKICIVTYDNFDYSQSKNEFILVNEKGLYLIKGWHNDKLDINKGDLVTINNCLLINNTILSDNKNIYKESSTADSTAEIKDIKMLMILVSYLNGGQYVLPSADDFMNKFMNAGSSIQNYLNEVSYSKAKILEIKAVGWVKVNRSLARYDIELTQDEWNKVVNDYSLDLSKYDYLAFIQDYFNPLDQGTLGYAINGKYYDTRFGKYIGRCVEQINAGLVDDIKTPASWTYFSRPFMHELGHTFGFGHANTFINNDITQINYYGDYTDVMGGLSGHYSGYFKESVNWLDSTTILTINKSGTYTINNFENGSGKKLAKIKLGNDNQPRYLYLEYRNGTGFDNNPSGFNQLHPYNNEGLFLKGNYEYFGFPASANAGELYMINAHSPIPNGWTETLNGTNVYVDTIKRFQVGPILSRTTSSITFSVNYLGKTIDYPILLLPVNEWYVPDTATYIDLRWGKILHASLYELQMSCWKIGGDASVFEKIYYTNKLADTTIRMFLPRDSYFWRVRTIDSLGNHSEWSKPFAFNWSSFPIQVIQINNPNGNSNWLVGSTQNITWTSAYVDNVKIDYCTDNYITFVNISPSTPAVSGSYKWVVPNITTKQCAIRITDVTDGRIYSILWFNIVQTTNINDEHTPNVFELAQNYPNPFNPSTIINYAIPFDSKVKIQLYNALGQCVREVNEGFRQSGYYELNFNSSRLASGVYFYRIEANSVDGKNNFTSTKKMILLK